MEQEYAGLAPADEPYHLLIAGEKRKREDDAAGSEVRAWLFGGVLACCGTLELIF
jgi:hypothetical protein